MATQADIAPHRVLAQAPQGPAITMGPITGMATSPNVTLRPVAQQRIPTELARMILLEQKSSAPRGIVKRRSS